MPEIAPSEADAVMRSNRFDQVGEPSRKSRLNRNLREMRDILASTSGTRFSYDAELLRSFAQNRVSAALPLLGMILALGGASSLWINPQWVMGWAIAALTVFAVNLWQCQRLLKVAPQNIDLHQWQWRLVVADLVTSLMWVGGVIALSMSPDKHSSDVLLFATLMVVAVQSMIASSLPLAVWAGTLPLSMVIVGLYLLRNDMQSWILAGLAGGAQAYFMMLTQRLHAATLSMLEARAEKDAMFIELEDAKMKSDDSAKRAEQASLAKSRFLAQMSHELRTPLNAILGFSEVMKGELLGPHTSPSYKEYSEDIHTSGRHLLNLINEILDLSRIEAGRYELNEESVSLVYIVEDCHHLLKMRAANKSITLHEAYEPELPKLWGDERAIRQITLNLLSNAIKFTPQGGDIWMKVGWTASGGQYLSVKDNGPGIPENEIPIVLSSFGQGSNAIKSAEQGTGLGLPIVKNLIALHGGTLNLKSKLREGTELIVTFPPERVMTGLAPIIERRNRPVEYEQRPEATATISPQQRESIRNKILLKNFG